ncbi:BAG family molecular chaperone regulator 3-like [Olea europaea var. sylvestris]|uniref:BAG family molecular chaperone regulator 3-like n=1 Tax=Olea europaea var. sylvestris TaxID=158386 RepID=UPI000C1D1B7C|nr:BAG family molecular chaperone regulator 3-like [Olea europaea var. sylvestris]
MMRMKTQTNGVPYMNGGSAAPRNPNEWELRPGGMLVQKRTDAEQNQAPPPTIRVRVKYGSSYHDIYISSQATFGELKKMLTGPTGLHHQDQKLFYKDKERDSKVFLDTVGVKDKSKIVLVEDPISQEKRYIEKKKNAKMERAAKSISEISLEVDKLAGQVLELESIISKGRKVAEKDVINLTELLMNQLLKLDGIIAHGEVKLQRKMQVKRVQRCVETLDVLKIKNSTPTSDEYQTPVHSPTSVQSQQQLKYSNGHLHGSSNGSMSSPVEQQQARHSFIDSPKQQQNQQHSRRSASGDVVITTKWETFESTPATFLVAPSTSSTMKPAQPNFSWDLLS